jgi:hypothetical protein
LRRWGAVCRVERLAFHFEVRLNVDFSGLHIDMSKEILDHDEGNTGLEKVHGLCMSPMYPSGLCRVDSQMACKQGRSGPIWSTLNLPSNTLTDARQVAREPRRPAGRSHDEFAPYLPEKGYLCSHALLDRAEYGFSGVLEGRRDPKAVPPRSFIVAMQDYVAQNAPAQCMQTAVLNVLAQVTQFLRDIIRKGT